MPDVMAFTVTPNGTVTINNFPRYTISFKVVRSDNQSQVIRDFTGANALSFPGVLSGLTATEREELLQVIVQHLISKRLE